MILYPKKIVDITNKYALTWYLVHGFALFFFVVWIPSHPELARATLAMLISVLPLLLPFFLWSLWWHTWTEYVRLDKYHNTEHSLLEIRIPEEISQTPYAMELVLRALYQTGEVDTPIETLWKGNTRPWFSLEIVSHEGNVRFYVWTRTRYKDLVESQFYAHYPSVQVYEVPDYTLKIPFDLDKYDFWGVEQRYQKPDPYPLTTYVEMGLDKPDLKEEYRYDPMNSIVEFFGSMQKGEHAWMQIICRGHRYLTGYDAHPAMYSHDATGKWLEIGEWAKHEVDKIAETTVDEKGKINYQRLTKGEQEDIAAIQRKLEKQAYDVGIRMVYVCEKNSCNSTRRTGFPSVLRTFEHGSEGRGLNGVRPIFVIGPFDYPWQDFRNFRRNRKKANLYEKYALRQYFFAPFMDRYPMVMNSEEIASIYHLPGQMTRTPTLERMLSKRSEAPSNLPV